MGHQSSRNDRTKMKTFILAVLVGFAAAGPSPLTSSHQVVSGHGAHNSHAVNHADSVAVAHSSPVLTHAAPLQYHAAPVTVAHPASTVLTHAAPLQYHAAPVISHAAPLQYHAAPAVVSHASPIQYHAAPVTVAHPTTTVVTHAAPVQYHTAPVQYHAAPVTVAHAAPVQYHAAPVTVTHVAPASYETEKPYSYQYGVADDYSTSNFNAAENADAAGNVQGSYSVALPDGRIQTVKYTSDNYNGYVADVSYEGTPVHPPAAVPVAAPAYQG